MMKNAILVVSAVAAALSMFGVAQGQETETVLRGGQGRPERLQVRRP